MPAPISTAAHLGLLWWALEGQATRLSRVGTEGKAVGQGCLLWEAPEGTRLT